MYKIKLMCEEMMKDRRQNCTWANHEMNPVIMLSGAKKVKKKYPNHPEIGLATAK